MTMSMYSSYTPEDFNNEEDIFGKWVLWCYCMNLSFTCACRGLIVHFNNLHDMTVNSLSYMLHFHFHLFNNLLIIKLS